MEAEEICRDFNGDEIVVGDKIIYVPRRDCPTLQRATVLKITKQPEVYWDRRPRFHLLVEGVSRWSTEPSKKTLLFPQSNVVIDRRV